MGLNELIAFHPDNRNKISTNWWQDILIVTNLIIKQKTNKTNFNPQTIVREMNRLGMIVDLSHVSSATMRDTLEVSEAPVIFSHSSAYDLCNSSRNVPNDILESVAKNGGLVMVNFYSRFLSCSDNATVQDAVGEFFFVSILF